MYILEFLFCVLSIIVLSATVAFVVGKALGLMPKNRLAENSKVPSSYWGTYRHAGQNSTHTIEVPKPASAGTALAGRPSRR